MNRKRALISLVDIILVLIIIVFTVILSSLSFTESSRVDFSQKTPLTVTLRIKEIPRKHDSLIKANDSVCYSENISPFGKIKYVSYTNSSVEFLDKLTNTSAIYKSPDKLDVLFSIECEAIINEYENIIGGKAVKVGDSLNLSTPDYSFCATVINIEVDEG